MSSQVRTIHTCLHILVQTTYLCEQSIFGTVSKTDPESCFVSKRHMTSILGPGMRPVMLRYLLKNFQTLNFPPLVTKVILILFGTCTDSGTAASMLEIYFQSFARNYDILPSNKK